MGRVPFPSTNCTNLVNHSFDELETRKGASPLREAPMKKRKRSEHHERAPIPIPLALALLDVGELVNHAGPPVGMLKRNGLHVYILVKKCRLRLSGLYSVYNAYSHSWVIGLLHYGRYEYANITARISTCLP